MSPTRWRATVSGSFRRAMDLVRDAVYGLSDLGVLVLSPADPRVVDHFGEFLFVASDRLRTIRLVQQRHLAAIEASDFLWLVCPDGYVGSSASMEVGYAVAVGTPIFAVTPPNDLTLRNYVSLVSSQSEVLARLVEPTGTQTRSALLDPEAAIEQAHGELEVIERQLLAPDHGVAARAAASAALLRQTVRGL